MSQMLIPEGMDFHYNDEVLGVEQLTVEGQMTGNGTLVTNCDLLVGLENIADTVSTACRVVPPIPVGDHFFIESFWDDEAIANNNQDIGILFAYAARVAPILVVDIDGREL